MLLVGWAGYAEYRVDAAARSIDVLLGGAQEQEAAVALVLSVLPMALPLFGLEPLHASAVSIGDGGAVVILGPSGAGKSTLAVELSSLGGEFLCDDAAAVDGNGRLVPGPPVANPRQYESTGDLAVTRYNGKEVRTIRSTPATIAPVRAVLELAPSAHEPTSVTDMRATDRFEAILRNARIPWVLQERRRSQQLARSALLARAPGARIVFDPAARNIRSTAEAVFEWISRV